MFIFFATSSLVAESVEPFINVARSVSCDNWWVTTYEFSESVDKTASALVKVLTYWRNVGSDNTPSFDDVLFLSHCSATLSLLSLIHISEPTRRTPISYAV